MHPDLLKFRKEIDERRNAVLLDWDTFLKQPRPRLISEVVERSKSALPGDFVPWAPGIVIASDYLLAAAGYRSGSRRPPGWRPGLPDVFRKYVRNGRLWGRGCREFWTIEREID